MLTYIQIFVHLRPYAHITWRILNLTAIRLRTPPHMFRHKRPHAFINGHIPIKAAICLRTPTYSNLHCHSHISPAIFLYVSSHIEIFLHQRPYAVYPWWKLLQKRPTLVVAAVEPMAAGGVSINPETVPVSTWGSGGCRHGLRCRRARNLGSGAEGLWSVRGA